jgi:hypothetical protein
MRPRGLVARTPNRSVSHEALQVDHARTQGWSWADIACLLGVSKQAAHRKHAPRLRLLAR